MDIINTNESFFRFTVLDSKQLVAVCFWSEWCDKCCTQGVILDEMSANFNNDKVLLAKVQIDDNTEMIETYEIKGLPLLLFFWKGKVVGKLYNLQEKEKIEGMLNNLLKEINNGKFSSKS